MKTWVSLCLCMEVRRLVTEFRSFELAADVPCLDNYFTLLFGLSHTQIYTLFCFDCQFVQQPEIEISREDNAVKENRYTSQDGRPGGGGEEQQKCEMPPMSVGAYSEVGGKFFSVGVQGHGVQKSKREVRVVLHIGKKSRKIKEVNSPPFSLSSCLQNWRPGEYLSTLNNSDSDPTGVL